MIVLFIACISFKALLFHVEFKWLVTLSFYNCLDFFSTISCTYYI